MVGEVELHGSLRADLLPGTAQRPTRGRVTRVRVVSVTCDPDERRWSPVPGSWRLRDVAAAPRWFDRGTHPPPSTRGPAASWPSTGTAGVDVLAAADRVAGLAATDEGFLLLLRAADGPRLARPGPDGALPEGPPLSAAGHVLGVVGGRRPFLTGTGS